MAGKKKEINTIILDDDKEEKITEIKEEKPKQEEEKEDIFEGDPIDVPIDESFYTPTKVKVQQIADDGTYELIEVDLQRKKADLDFGLDAQDVLARKAAHWDNINDKKGTRTVSGIVLSKIFTKEEIERFGLSIYFSTEPEKRRVNNKGNKGTVQAGFSPGAASYTRSAWQRYSRAHRWADAGPQRNSGTDQPSSCSPAFPDNR